MGPTEAPADAVRAGSPPWRGGDALRSARTPRGSRRSPGPGLGAPGSKQPFPGQPECPQLLGPGRGPGLPGTLGAGCQSRAGMSVQLGRVIPFCSVTIEILGLRPQGPQDRGCCGRVVPQALQLGVRKGWEGCWRVSEKTARPRGPQEAPAWVAEGRGAGRGTAAGPSLAAAGPPEGASPFPSPAPPTPAGPRPARAPPLPSCPLGLRAAAGGLTALMGDGFQGEISSSVESLSFTAAHKMSSPPGCAGCVLLSRRI